MYFYSSDAKVNKNNLWSKSRNKFYAISGKKEPSQFVTNIYSNEIFAHMNNIQFFSKMNSTFLFTKYLEDA